MSLTLQQINLGTAPAGKDGDTQRTANSKTNDNMTAIAAAVDGLSSSVQSNTAALGGKADKTVTDALQATTSSFTGSVAMFARNAAPAGWLKANGALVSRTTYAALFAAIGTTFGAGDGSTTFALPDLRGEFWRGWDDARGVDSGRAFGSFQDTQLRDHYHTLPHAMDGGGLYSIYSNAAATTAAYGASGVSAYYRSVAQGAGVGNGPISASNSSGVTGFVGSGSETRPRNVALLACIKY